MIKQIVFKWINMQMARQFKEQGMKNKVKAIKETINLWSLYKWIKRGKQENGGKRKTKNNGKHHIRRVLNLSNRKCIQLHLKVKKEGRL